ncbi:MAG: formate dehydrogenase accessory sulfurtransferase FdhD [Endozoicomonas sp.]
MTTTTRKQQKASLHGYDARLEQARDNQLPEEVATALSYNGLSHVVMMVTPSDLEDFALGFSLAEGFITSRYSLKDIQLSQMSDGLLLDMTISQRDFHRLKQVRRNLQGRTGCGLCGHESLATAIPDLSALPGAKPPAPETFFNIRQHMRSWQKKGAETGALHAAVLLNQAGDIVLCREDIGRHNALDKLLGAAINAGYDLSRCCVVISSRCSVELVQKAIRTGLASLASLSSPSTLAIDTARRYKLNLIHLPKQDAPRLYSHG